MVSGFGESLLLELAAELILKTAELGYHIIQDSRNYATEERNFKDRMQIQMAIWRAIGEKLKMDEIKKRIRPYDLEIFYKIEKKLYRLLFKFCQRCNAKYGNMTPTLDNLSIEVKIRELQESGVFDNIDEEEEEEARLDFLFRSKKQIDWTLRRERKESKLVKEAEEWSNRLQQLASWTIPQLFPSATPEQVVKYIADPSGSLTQTNLKGKIILSKSGSDTTQGGLGVLKEVEEGPFRLDVTRIEIQQRGLVTDHRNGRFTIDPLASAEEIKNQLGGNTKRQWATLKDEKGRNRQSVIVEFKPKVSSDASDNRLHTDSDAPISPIPHDDPVNLVRTLRLAAQNPNSFRVLQCEGWCDFTSNYGLVYKLPSMKNHFICETLTNILLKPEYRKLLHHDLENRIKLGRALARTLLELHTVDWLHESFYPDNILLFGESVGQSVSFDWTKPYLVGFGSSRHEREYSGSYNFKLRWSYQLHNHPDRNDGEKHNPYRKLYDIYSLGVVLLELGRGSSFMSDTENAKWDIKVGAHKLRENLIQEAMTLPVLLGTTYRGIVIACLNDELKAADYDGRLTDEFRTRVCDKLEQMRINV